MYGETMLLPAIPDIIKEFKIPYDTSSWILSSYLISGAVATPIAGKLSDIYGRKKMVMTIMIIYIFGISLGGFSPDITFLVIARVIQGIGISMFPIALGMIRDQLPEQKLAIGVGIFNSMFAAGSVVGLTLGANIIENFGWRTTFFSIIFVALGLWFIIRRYISDNHDHKSMMSLPNIDSVIDSSLNKLEKRYRSGIRALDIKGAITLSVTITSFLLVLSYSESENVTGSPLVPVFLSIGVISLVTFCVHRKEIRIPSSKFTINDK